MEQRWDSIQQFIRPKKRFLITTHLNPDGDALGSELALAHYLEDVGKAAFIINVDPLPEFFQFLTNGIRIEEYDIKRHERLIRSCDGCIVVDVSEWKRLGQIADLLRALDTPVACIDHHLSNASFGLCHVIDNSASSTGELVYDFLKTVGAAFSQEIVDALYTCILTDTGSFKFSNTTAQTHRITADLLDKGAQFQKIYTELYESDSISRSLLKGHLLASMRFECNGTFAWFVMSQELLRQVGACLWESEGFSELPRAIKGVEISIFFSEDADGRAKASFRSKGRIPINDLAQQFGGGGHKYAAGAALAWPLEEAIPKVIAAAKKYLQQRQEVTA